MCKKILDIPKRVDLGGIRKTEQQPKNEQKEYRLL